MCSSLMLRELSFLKHWCDFFFFFLDSDFLTGRQVVVVKSMDFGGNLSKFVSQLLYLTICVTDYGQVT